MKSLQLGKSTSKPEVTHISVHGFWIYVNGAEYGLPFSEYPWFRKATVAQIQDVRLLHKHHLYWPSLDVDLELESLRHPANYPLVYH